MEDFTCTREIKPLVQWVDEEEEGNCHPCLVAPLSSYYLGTLEKAGEIEKVDRLKSIYEGGDVLTICRELDKLKKEVGDDLRKKLEDLDCYVQSYKPDDDSA